MTPDAAADRIEVLEAENEQFRRDLSHTKAMKEVWMNSDLQAASRIEALEAALREIADLQYSNTSAAQIARAALDKE